MGKPKPTKRSTAQLLAHSSVKDGKVEGRHLTCFLFTVRGCPVCKGIVHLFAKWCGLQGKGMVWLRQITLQVLVSAFSMGVYYHIRVCVERLCWQTA